MASIRTARVMAALTALPLAAVLFTGTALADNEPLADNGSNASATQQVAGEDGATNQSNTANVNGYGFTVVDQSNTNHYHDYDFEFVQVF